MSVLLLPVWLIFSIVSPAQAECFCQCVDGVHQPICDSAAELPPQCAPQLCPATSFQIRPADEDVIEPIGTQRCVPRQVFENGQYVWRELCE